MPNERQGYFVHLQLSRYIKEIEKSEFLLLKKWSEKRKWKDESKNLNRDLFRIIMIIRLREVENSFNCVLSYIMIQFS